MHKKPITIGIILLFIGASILPSISGNTEEKTKISIITEKSIVNPSSSSMFFTENQGQYPAEVLFKTQIPEATIYLCKNKIVSVFTSEQKEEQNDIMTRDRTHMRHFRMEESQQIEVVSIVAEFVDSNTDGIIIGMNPLPHKNNYFIGDDSTKWYTDVPNYQSVIYQNIYPGIDLIYYSAEGSLKYDFIVHPGSNPDQITIQYQGAENLEITSGGDLKVTTRLGSLREERPIIYQDIDGIQQIIKGNYKIEDNDIFRFAIEEPYNQNYPLIIDPGLAYSTYLGGNKPDAGIDIAVDSSGCAYVAGLTRSNDFPTTNPYDDTFNGVWDGFVTKLSSQGNTLEYSTYIGGIGSDGVFGIVVDNSGCAYVTGGTYSNDFPTENPYDDTYNGIDGVVTKLSPSGNQLIFSTYLGGNARDYCNSIDIDGNNCVYVTGITESSDFPTKNAYDDTFNADEGFWDSFVTKFTNEGNALIYSTYLGGEWDDEGNSIDVDNNGCAYITGYTISPNFPTKNAYDYILRYWDYKPDCFVTKFSPQGNTLEYSTFLGGTKEDWGEGIVVDSSGCAYITGGTRGDFPVVNAYDDTYNGDDEYFETADCFVTKISPQGNTLKFSTYLGGSDMEYGFGIDIDSSGCAYVAGGTHSNDFPTTNPYDDTFNGVWDGFVTKFYPKGDNLVYSTYLGGCYGDLITSIIVDSNNCAYVTGETRSNDFPTENAYDDAYNNGTCSDAFITKLPEDGGSGNFAPNTPEKPSGPTNGIPREEYTYTSITADPENDDIYYLFDWGDGSDSGWVGPYNSGKQGNASYSWNSRGSYEVKVKAKDEKGAESAWSEPINVKMPRNKMISIKSLFLWLFERFPFLEKILALV